MTKYNFAVRLTALLLALSLTGCIFFETPRERAMRKDPNFQAGYADGCASASARGTDLRRGDDIRDAAAYQASKPYRAGWAAGYATCNNQRGGVSNPDVSGTPGSRMPGQL